jgi:hypothetical protein
MVKVGGRKKELGNMKKVEVQIPGRNSYGKKGFYCPVQQTQGEVASFQNLDWSIELLHQSLGMKPAPGVVRI